MNHKATPQVWDCQRQLPLEVQRLAGKCLDLLKSDPHHASLQFEYVGSMRSVRVGLHYRGLGNERGPDTVWFWIGLHAEYDRLVGR